MAQLDGVIAKLVDKDGEVKFPVTNTKAVETSDGRNLEEIVEVVDNMPNIAIGIANTVFDTRIVEVNTEMQELKQINTVVGNNTRDINTIQNQLTQHLGENSNSFLTIDNNINEIRGIISVQGTSLEEQKIRITDIEDSLPNIKEVIDSAEELTTTIDNMRQQIDSNNEQIDSNNEQIESINGQVDSINEQIESIEGQIDSLDTQVNSIEDDMSTPEYVDCVVHGNTSRIGLQEDAQVVNLKDGYVKNIALKGNTLVNLAKVKTTNSYNICSEKNISVKPNTKYIALFDGSYSDVYGANYALIVTSYVFINTINSGDDLYLMTVGNGKGTEHIPSKGASYLIFTTKEDEYYIHIRTGGTNGVVYDNMMILEYQDGMENLDIPYFEGMQSVEQPTLTTTGKNLFNLPLIKQQSYVIESDEHSITVINELERNLSQLFGFTHYPNEQYTLIYNRDEFSGKGAAVFSFKYTDGSRTYLDPGVVNISSPEKTLSFIELTFTDLGITKLSNICLVKDIVNDLTYEPYKSNILTTSKEVKLRGIGDVKDEFNPQNNTLTRRIGELVFNGSEDWYGWVGTQNTEYVATFCREAAHGNSKSKNIPTICDSFAIYDSATSLDTFCLEEGLAINSNAVYLRIAKERLGGDSVELLKTWLEQNPITVQYELESSTTETVGTKNKFYLYENGHVHVSAKNNFIIPEVTYTASTNFRGQVDIILDKNNSLLNSSTEAELAYPYTIVKRNGNGEVKTNTAFQYSDNTSIRHISESPRIEWGNSTGWYTIHDQETLPTEKGTWTPYCYCDNDGKQISLSSAFGTYSRVGDIVLIQGRVTGIMPETSQGAFRVGGLPYICRGSNTGVTIAYSKGIYTGNGYQLYARVESGSSIISLVAGSIANNSVGGSLITNEHVANFDLMFSMTIKLTNEY